MPFASLGLAPELCAAVDRQGYTQPTPVQEQVIPIILEGRDVRAAAQTGTGKTAAFTLPLLQRLLNDPPKEKGQKRLPRVLVLVPTRELAQQVQESVEIYRGDSSLRSAAVYGGVSINPQIDALKKGADVVIATPGRLLDHYEQKTIDFGAVGALVLDEADRMLDMGFIRDIRRILSLLPKERQNLLFSATFSPQILGLAHGLLKDPAVIEIEPQRPAAETVEHVVHAVPGTKKKDLLSWLVGDGNWEQVLVFTRTKHGADRLARQLKEDGLNTDAIHGNRTQGARSKALDEFKAGKIRVLVATDVAARGIDIDQLPYVVNFELPNVPEDYVHRIGRTGRAGRGGQAVSLVSPTEAIQLRAIERLINQKIPRVEVEGYTIQLAMDKPNYRPPVRSFSPRRGGRRR